MFFVRAFEFLGSVRARFYNFLAIRVKSCEYIEYERPQILMKFGRITRVVSDFMHMLLKRYHEKANCHFQFSTVRRNVMKILIFNHFFLSISLHELPRTGVLSISVVSFREKRLEQERTLLAQQMAGLEEELCKRTSELQTTRAEASARALLTDTRLQQREEELRIANEAVAQLRESAGNTQRRCDELAQKLEEQRSHELAMHASYREEVGAQTRLADLYKGMADEANSKAEEFSEAVKELQTLLEQATEQYGTLESEHAQLKLQHDDTIAENTKRIEELTTELDRANELLKSIKQERLDQAVEQLAPTAAIASRVLKKGLSLTQIYTQLVDATNELAMERDENERLKSQMDVILRELEEKAPALQQEREEYELAMENNTALTSQLEEIHAENHRLREAADESSRIAKHHTRENQRLKSELADLARQVSVLLCFFDLLHF